MCQTVNIIWLEHRVLEFCLSVRAYVLVMGHMCFFDGILIEKYVGTIDIMARRIPPTHMNVYWFQIRLIGGSAISFT